MSDEPQVQESFYVDEFFATEEDPGIEVPIKIKGRMVPITFKSGLTVEDKARAQQMAIKREIVDNKVVLKELNESEAAIYMLAVAIKSWPFKDRKTGAQFPVTPENIRKLMGGADEMAEIIKKIDEEGTAALLPFVAPSTED